MTDTNTKSVNILRLDSQSNNFAADLTQKLQRDMLVAPELTETVLGIVTDVKARGDTALLEYANRFDGMSASSVSELVVLPEQMLEALELLPGDQADALREAANRIRLFHEKQSSGSWQYEEADGSVYGQKVTPLQRAGVYVPGGKANYPSSMLMLAIPAKVAGVKEVIATVPTAYGEDSRLIFAAAALAGVDKIITVGGAQAIAALAYGTDTVPAVDKIAGPGNVFVTVAKKLVYGEVGIDMLAGPSELTIICDGQTDPDWIAMDLFSQAEHDEQAQSILISPDSDFINAVESSIVKLLPAMERRDIIAKSLTDKGLLIKVSDLAEAVAVSNEIAPEHLELSVENPEELMADVENAGAIFLGRYTAEALGDYCAGPSHVLPTSGSARFFSGISVSGFQKRSSIIHCSEEAADRLGRVAAIMAKEEKLQAHALSAEYRVKK